MLLTKIKKAVEYRLKTGRKLPNDEALQDILHEANIYVALNCVPSELVANGSEKKDYEVLRLLEDDFFVKVPEYPNFSKPLRHLQIDEGLTYAVINYTCFILSEDRKFKALCDEAIGVYNTQSGDVLYGKL